MPNTIGGKNYKKTKSGNVRRRSKNPNLTVDITTGFDHYGVVMKRLGNNRLQVKIDTGVDIQAVIPGKFMKKVWFNSGDFIHVRRESDNYYDVIQKLINDDEKSKAQTIMSKQMNGDELDIFRQNDDNDGYNNFDLIEESENESDNDSEKEPDKNEDLNDFNGLNGFNDKPKKKEVINPNRQPISAEQLIRKTVNLDKLQRKHKEKERDVSRRSEQHDYSEKPTSLVEDSESSSESSESKQKDTQSNGSEIDIDDI
jgi:initiation factor 1A